MDAIETHTSSETETRTFQMPKGSWKKKAARYSDGAWGRVKQPRCLNEKPQLTAKLLQPDGTYTEKSILFDDLDTNVTGGFELGCSAGHSKLTTKSILQMCDAFDDFDYSGTGFLTAEDVFVLTEVVGQKLQMVQVARSSAILISTMGQGREG